MLQRQEGMEQVHFNSAVAKPEGVPIRSMVGFYC